MGNPAPWRAAQLWPDPDRPGAIPVGRAHLAVPRARPLLAARPQQGLRDQPRAPGGRSGAQGGDFLTTSLQIWQPEPRTTLSCGTRLNKHSRRSTRCRAKNSPTTARRAQLRASNASYSPAPANRACSARRPHLCLNRRPSVARCPSTLPCVLCRTSQRFSKCLITTETDRRS